MRELETLRRELQRRGLPRRYVERTCAELDDHVEDAAADLEHAGESRAGAVRAAWERVGCPVRLAEGLYQQRAADSFCLRHPSLVAVLLALCLFCGVAVLGLGVVSAIALSFPAVAVNTLNGASRFVIPCFAAILAVPALQWLFGHRRPLVVGLSLLALLSFTADVRVESTDGRLLRVVLRLVR